MYVLVCRGLPNDDVVRRGRGTVFQEIRPGAGFKTGDFVKEKLGGLVFILQTDSKVRPDELSHTNNLVNLFNLS